MENLIKEFPPTLILVGSNEILLDDSKLLYNEIIKNQSKAKLSIYEEQTHVWPLDNINTAESRKAIKEIIKFLSN